MKSQHIIVVSDQPLIREELKKLIEDETHAVVTTIPNLQNIADLLDCTESTSIVIGQSETSMDRLDYILEIATKVAKIVVLDANENKMSIFEYHQLESPTAEQLIKVIS